ICDEDRYHLFESRRYGGTTGLNLPALAAQWSQETLSVPNASPYVALPLLASGPSSLAVGRTPWSGCPLGRDALVPALPLETDLETVGRTPWSGCPLGRDALVP